MIRNGNFFRLLVAFTATVAIAACSEGPAGPGPRAANVSGYNVSAGQQADASLLGSVLGSLLTPVKVVTRAVPLNQDITTSTVVTPNGGGRLSIPAAGLQVSIPAGAVSVPMTITVTALKGNLVAYDFGPAGTKFAAPLHVTQSIAGTNASLLSVLLGGLHAAYFANDNQLNFSSGTALVNQLLPLNLDALSGQASFDISHFSGYILASGFSGDGSDSAVQQNDALRRAGQGGGGH